MSTIQSINIIGSRERSRNRRRLKANYLNNTLTTDIYTLSLHDALPIYRGGGDQLHHERDGVRDPDAADRKSTRLNTSHRTISYAVFCLKKKHKHYCPAYGEGRQ